MHLASPKYPTDSHGWAELLPTRQPTKRLQGVHRHRWVVIGAGLTGLACARRLAEIHPDQHILLLDARCIGQGASGRNSGFAVSTSHFSGQIEKSRMNDYRRVNRINQFGLDLLSQQISDNAIDCQWQRDGFYHTAADQMAVNECHHFRQYLDELNINFEAYDRTALASCLGTHHYQCGIHVKDGALVQPAALVRGLADTLPVNVLLHEQSPVLKIESGNPLTLHLDDATVKTDKLLLATNYEAPALGFLNRYIIGSTLSGSFTRRLNQQELASLGSLNEWGVLSLHGGGATLRLTSRSPHQHSKYCRISWCCSIIG